MGIGGAKKIDQSLSVSDIVSADYRTADVFRKYGIDFCCGGKWPLKIACEAKNLEVGAIKRELENAIRTISIPNYLQFDTWDIDFLTDYIVNVHHQYLRKALPEAEDFLVNFIEGHEKKFPFLPDLLKVFKALSNDLFPHLQSEESIIFPYIRQIAHAYHGKEAYAGLLVRTLRKPVENVMIHEHETVNRFLTEMRELSDNYTAPANACVNHKVTFLKLLEVDNDLVQHMHLENDILFPRAIAMEKELLEARS